MESPKEGNYLERLDVDEDNIKMDHRSGVKWIYLAEDKDRWRAL
jgi:hypothetical protein